jgi:hypothetical protein
VRTRVDEKLKEEAKRFAFRFACDDCAHFDGRRCAHGYPPEPRRALHLEVVFCKEFELGA